MDATPLFHSQNGDISAHTIQEALRTVRADECDVLYIHTGMRFGTPAGDISRKTLLSALLDCLESLRVGTLIFPTFTFSFCNNEAYDRQKSPSQMGALNEFARKSGKGVRSADPLLSVYIIGKRTDLAENLSQYSIGEGSNYDKLHHCGDKVKFLFFGADMRECFTYTHYMEAVMKSPYRYDREFSGLVIDGEKRQQTTCYLYTTYANCTLNPVPVVYNEMKQRGQLLQTALGNGTVLTLEEQDGFATIAELLEKDPYCLTNGTFDPSRADRAYDNSVRVVSVK